MVAADPALYSMIKKLADCVALQSGLDSLAVWFNSINGLHYYDVKWQFSFIKCRSTLQIILYKLCPALTIGYK